MFAVSLMARRSRVILEVTDDGKGFGNADPAGAAWAVVDARAGRLGRRHPGDPLRAREGTTVRLSVAVRQP